MPIWLWPILAVFAVLLLYGLFLYACHLDDEDEG